MKVLAGLETGPASADGRTMSAPLAGKFQVHYKVLDIDP
jgi:hypothetical protein